MLFTTPAQAPSARPSAAQAPVLSLQPVSRAIALHDLLRAAPSMQGDIGQGASGLPLVLSLQLCGADGLPLPRAVVCVWQHDPQGWTLDFEGDELDTVTRMRGTQVCDELGWVGFRTVYPGAYRDGTVTLYLQVYLHDGHWVQARSDICLLLPTEVDGPVRGIPLAQPLPGRAQPPRFPPGRTASRQQVPRLELDPQLGGLRGQARLYLAA